MGRFRSHVRNFLTLLPLFISCRSGNVATRAYNSHHRLISTLRLQNIYVNKTLHNKPKLTKNNMWRRLRVHSLGTCIYSWALFMYHLLLTLSAKKQMVATEFRRVRGGNLPRRALIKWDGLVCRRCTP